ncbi:hypothetical protein BB560_001658 [Smittium megazygosporum]|uniref:Nuclear pore complex protein n=1 Tax=Smittium megazygosporum TaxID=133381 RepID=A0A2T9ZH56_9FUNG|nr:hypothetical protein BB560_001658 [Smittium megazygosporum]
MKIGSFSETPEEWNKRPFVSFAQIERFNTSSPQSPNLDYSNIDSYKYEILQTEISEILVKIDKFKDICSSGQSKSFENIINQNKKAEEWYLERETWDLVSRLYALRMKRGISFPDKKSRLSSDEISNQLKNSITDYSKMQKILEIDDFLAEKIVIKKWLEHNAPAISLNEDKKDYWLFTLREAKLNANKKDKDETLVSQLDPDAPSRLQQSLALEDQEYDNLVNKRIFQCIRRGQFEEALNICINNGEPWRAASLSGGAFFSDKSLDTTKGPYDELIYPNKKSKVSGGNVNRALWKHMCFLIATESDKSPYEKAYYAALAGSLDQILPVCNNFEDKFWAEICCVIENRIDSILSKSFNFYESQVSNPPLQKLDQGHISESCYDIFSNLLSDNDSQIKQNALNQFREIQVAIMENNLNEYLEKYSEYLKNGGFQNTNIQFLRFIAHLILVSRDAKQYLDPIVTDTIITYYSQFLIIASLTDIVPVYLSKLPSVISDHLYSNFLSGVDKSIEDRKYFLDLAEESNLDVLSIAKLTTIKILDSFKSEDFDGIDIDEIYVSSINDPITDDELVQIRALEWINFYQRLHTYSLVLVTGLARKFFILGRANAVIALFNSLPTDFVKDSWRFFARILAKSRGPSDSLVRSYDDEISITENSVWEDALKLYYGETESRSVSENSSNEGDEILLQNSNKDALNEDFEVLKWPTLLVTSFFLEFVHLNNLSEGYIALSRFTEHMDNYKNMKEIMLADESWKAAAIENFEISQKVIRKGILESNWLGEWLALKEYDSEQNKQRSLEMGILRQKYIPDCLTALYNILISTKDFIPGNLAASFELVQMVADDSYAIYKELLIKSKRYPNGKIYEFLYKINDSAYGILK